MLADRVQAIGETKDACRKRIMDQCRTTWKRACPEGAALRRQYQLKAIDMNRRQVPHQPQPDLSGQVIAINEDHARKYFAPLLAYDGTGPFGIGDDLFGVSVKAVAAGDSGKSFVQTFSAAWKRRTEPSDEPSPAEPGGTSQLSCYETLGFCRTMICDTARYRRVEFHIIKFLQGYRKQHLASDSGRNKGPNAEIPHPLLFLWDMSFGFALVCGLFRSHECFTNLNINMLR